MQTTPTTAQFGAYQAAFDYFNRVLFAGCLPAVILNFSRHAGALGFFAAERWSREGGERRHEISLNPEHLGNREPRAVFGTLVHEMVHLWQQQHGKPSARGYHNRQWAEKMRTVGLEPSSTGAEGGKATGFRMSHYVQDGGAYARAFEALPAECLLPWQGSAERKSGGGGRSKTKFTCPACQANAWGKPGLKIMCADDGCLFESEDGDDEDGDDGEED